MKHLENYFDIIRSPGLPLRGENEDVIAGLIRRNEMSMVCGQSGVGKTSICVDMGYRVATGKMFYAGSSVTQGTVLYVTDDSYPLCSLRLKVLEMDLGYNQNFYFLKLPEYRHIFKEESNRITILEEFKSNVQNLSMIIYDLRLLSAINNSKSLFDNLGYIRHISRETGAHVMVICDIKVSDGPWAGFSGAVTSQFDTILSVTPDLISTSKNRNHPGWQRNYSLIKTNLGINEGPVEAVRVKLG